MTKRIKLSIVAAVLYLAIMVTGMFRLTNVHHIKYGDPIMMEYLIGYVFFAVLTSIVIYLLFFRGTGFKKIKFNYWIVEFAVFVVLILLAQIFLGNYKHANMHLVWTIVATTVMVGIGEEMLFRGLVYTAFKEKYGVFVGVLVSAFIFGFLHITNIAGGQSVKSTLLQMLSAGLSGIVGAWVFYKTENLIPTMIYHAVWDMMGLLGLVVSVDMTSYISLVQNVFEIIAAIVIIIYIVKNLLKGYKSPEDIPPKVKLQK